MTWKVMRAVLLACGLGCAGLALSLLMGAGVDDPGTQATRAAQRSLHDAATHLRDGVMPADSRPLIAGLELAERIMMRAHEAVAQAEQRRNGLGVAVGMVAAINLLLWMSMPASAGEAAQRG